MPQHALNPCPDFETLYDFETAVEGAAQKVSTASKLAAFVQKATENLPGERIDIQYRGGAATGHKGQIRAGVFSDDAWNGMLGFRITTPRFKAKDKRYDPERHGRMRGLIRWQVQYFADKFGVEVLPWHVLTQIKERSSEPSVVLDGSSDVSTLWFDVMLSIRTGAWPNL